MSSYRDADLERLLMMLAMKGGEYVVCGELKGAAETWRIRMALIKYAKRNGPGVGLNVNHPRG